MFVKEEDKYSESVKKRLAYYEKFGFDEDALNDEDNSIRLGYYVHNSFSEDAKFDESAVVRKHYFDKFGYDTQAKYDSDASVRFGYYSQKGFLDLNALEDIDENIALKAEKEFRNASKELGYNEINTQFYKDEVDELLEKGYYINSNIIKPKSGEVV